jgi:hypothetical protein
MVPPEPSSVSTATADPLYKTVRKLTSVAFNPVNIRCTTPDSSLLYLPHNFVLVLSTR